VTRRAWTTRGSAALALAAAATFGALRVADAQGSPDGDVAAGRRLFEVGCISCHGLDAKGVPERGPTLVGVGAASAYFYLSSGRMPMDDPDGQTRRKPPAYSPDEIDDLVAYIASLGDGPPIPDIDPADGDLSEGQQLYTANCAACHNSAGSGGALGQAIYAPSVTSATPTQVAAAVRIGPGAMPIFGPASLTDDQLASVLRYVQYLDDPEDPGGASLGRVGPVPEGFVAWIFGIGAVMVIVRWLGAPTRIRLARAPSATAAPGSPGDPPVDAPPPHDGPPPVDAPPGDPAVGDHRSAGGGPA
jgi:ubiquinol-cytochrome c reductase cytochrome c subunit